MLWKSIIYHNGLISRLRTTITFGYIEHECEFAGLKIAGTTFVFSEPNS